jgi:hypothetical protein
LTSVDIPSSVTQIESGVFMYCTSLTNVNIPSSVTEIGYYAFGGCSDLRSVYVYAETPPSISANAFDGCDSKNYTLYVPKGTYDAYWLSVLYALNGRKVAVWILIRYEKVKI